MFLGLDICCSCSVFVFIYNTQTFLYYFQLYLFVPLHIILLQDIFVVQYLYRDVFTRVFRTQVIGNLIFYVYNYKMKQ